MAIDWFTFVAQIVNFLVLVWLLKRFLYGRIVQAMNEREARIASRLAEAEQVRADAENEAARFRARNQEWNQQHDELLASARREADALRQQLTDTARQEIEETQFRWLESLRREQQSLLQELRERVGQQVISVSRRVLEQLAGIELEREIVNVFLKRLHSLSAEQQRELVAAAGEANPEVEVRTAFSMTPERRDEVAQALRSQLTDDLEVRFTMVPELICGIELHANAHRLAWNVDSYLAGLEDRVFGVLEQLAENYVQAQ